MDHQTVGQANNIGAAVAVAPVHTVMVGAGSFDHCDFAILDADFIVTGAAVDHKRLVDTKVYGMQNLALTEDLGMGGSFAGEKQESAQTGADQQKKKEKKDPGFCFHRDNLAWAE